MGSGHSTSDMALVNTRLDYVEKAIEKQETNLDRRFIQADKEVKLAADALGARMDHLNGFRQTLTDQNSTFITREAYEAKHLLLEEKIAVLEKLVYVGVGIAIVVEIALRLVK